MAKNLKNKHYLATTSLDEMQSRFSPRASMYLRLLAFAGSSRKLSPGLQSPHNFALNGGASGAFHLTSRH